MVFHKYINEEGICLWDESIKSCAEEECWGWKKWVGAWSDWCDDNEPRVLISGTSLAAKHSSKDAHSLITINLAIYRSSSTFDARINLFLNRHANP
jgi:hypothetical protein